MDQRPRRSAGKPVTDHHRAVLGDDHAVQDQGLAAGTQEAEHLPVVNDLDLGERHQQIGDVRGIALLPEKASDNGPLRIVAGARERVMPAEPPSRRAPCSNSPGLRAQRRTGKCRARADRIKTRISFSRRDFAPARFVSEFASLARSLAANSFARIAHSQYLYSP
jgi:hypothetical protein